MSHRFVAYALLGLLGLTMIAGFTVRPAAASSCPAGTFCGTLYVSTVGNGVDTIAFNYVSGTHTLTFGPDSVLASGLQGGQADGLVFDSVTHDLIVGVNCGGPNSVVEINPSNGAVVSTISTAGVQPSHLMVDQQGNAWASSDGCPTGTPVVQIPLPAQTSTVSTHAITGDTNYVNTLVFTSSTTQAFYTASGCCGGFGQVGTLDLSTFVATCIKDVTGACVNFPAAHGGTYDPYTGDVIIFGDDHITQINPTTLAVVSDLNVPGGGFDQGTVDGFGHLLVAGSGGVYFLDYSATSLVGSPLNFAQENSCCAGGGSDDVAPLIGPGSTVTGVPEFPFGFLAVVAVTVPALMLLRTRYSKLLG
jgi:hypothetical protein